MTREEAIELLRSWDGVYIGYSSDEVEEALEMAIKALSQVSEIEENIIKYMKKYPNHVGNTDFWEGFYACRNVVLQLDDEEYAPKEQEPCEKCKYFDGNSCQHYDYKVGYTQGYKDANKRFRQEPCDDAISRDAVNTLVDELARAISDERCHIPQRGRDTGHIMHDILDLPSVYCPNCGAKMVEPQERSDT